MTRWRRSATWACWTASKRNTTEGDENGVHLLLPKRRLAGLRPPRRHGRGTVSKRVEVLGFTSDFAYGALSAPPTPTATMPWPFRTGHWRVEPAADSLEEHGYGGFAFQ
jgi:hypothetical protein